jgi:hypothetical protein
MGGGNNEDTCSQVLAKQVFVTFDPPPLAFLNHVHFVDTAEPQREFPN